MRKNWILGALASLLIAAGALAFMAWGGRAAQFDEPLEASPAFRYLVETAAKQHLGTDNLRLNYVGMSPKKPLRGCATASRTFHRNIDDRLDHIIVFELRVSEPARIHMAATVAQPEASRRALRACERLGVPFGVAAG